MPKRARFRQPNGPLKPEAPGSRFALGTWASSKTIWPVAEARRLILPLMAGVAKPSVPRSTRKPRMRPSNFAHTTATSAMGALVIHVFTPRKR